MKLISFNVARIFVALMFVFSITANVFAFYHKEGNYLVCDYCGAAHINSFPRDGHYSWCKYAPAPSSSSGGGSSTIYVPKTISNSSDYAMASMATMALGSMLSDLISGSSKTPEQIAAEQAAKAAKQAAIKAENEAKSQEEKILLRDEQFWKSGDYVIKEGDLKFRGGKAYGVYNNQTQKWVFSADKEKNNEGRLAIFRKVKRNDDYWITKSGNIRLLDCKDEKSSYTKPLVWMYYAREYDKKEKYWNLKKDHKFFIINDKDELEGIEALVTGFNNVFLLSQNGKYGVTILNADSLADKNYKYGYYGYEIKIPVEYDSIEIFNNFLDQLKNKTRVEVSYLAKKGNDVYMFGFFGARLSPKLAEYETITALPNIMNDFYMVSKQNKIGAVDSAGNIKVPLVYSDPIKFYDSVKDIVSMVSFTKWYQDKAKPYLTKKDKYEKEADYQARMKDKEKQEKYIVEKMKNAQINYIDEFKDKVLISLGNYDSETEKFIIGEYVYFAATKKTVTETVKQQGNKQVTTKNYSDDSKTLHSWNTIEFPVPIKEAEEFEKNFNDIKQEALKTATFGISNDIIAIAKITFKMPNGKTYTFDSTKTNK